MLSVGNGERLGRESTCVVVKGTGHPGVQSEWVGTTWFRRVVQKDSCFDLEGFSERFSPCYTVHGGQEDHTLDIQWQVDT